MGKSNTLSRLLNNSTEALDNQNIVLLCLEFFAVWAIVLQLKTQGVKSIKEPYIEFTQENSMKFLSTICLSYILWAHDSCYTNLIYSKEYMFVLRLIYIIHTI